MGYAYYLLSDGREAGYSVVAECDWPGCGAVIDRGLAYLCGEVPEGGEDSCGGYFCGAHLHWPDDDEIHGYRCPTCTDEIDSDTWATERALDHLRGADS